MSASRIVELAANIATNTGILDDYLRANGLPTPSFEVDGPLESLVPQNEHEIEAARVAIIDDTLELRRLVLGPRDHLMSFSANELLSQQAITRFRLAHSFPVHSEASFAEIAEASGITEADAKQLIRRAEMQGIFAERQPGVVSHTAPSRLLAEDPILHDWVGANADDLWPVASQTCNAMQKYPRSEEPAHTGFGLANNTSKSMYDFFSDHPERARRFANAMRASGRREDLDVEYVVDGFPWSEVGQGTVVDIGGSEGMASIAIARKYPGLSFVVQDLEAVIEEGQKNVPADVADRIQFMTHDFFTPQPVANADVYFLRHILHNWSDKYCLRILRSLIPALKRGAKIVVNDTILPDPGSLSNWKETKIRSTDLTMKVIQNSHERALDDWKKLFEAADSRFIFERADQPRGSTLWIIIVEWKGD
ncbi:S-adenosyl-L-methionine-dependent methyltransferase [Xylariomycetidae sp. FL0641]|nr:S-adenosyl-L-methionine-dependent methyltransferase [Xylariomycetidae sp. FL0641]